MHTAAIESHCFKLLLYIACRYFLDDQAKEWANHLKAQPEYESMHPMMCMFVLLPYMHAETVEDQEVCHVT